MRSNLNPSGTEQLDHDEIAGGGISLHWPDLDADLSVAGLMAGLMAGPDWQSM